MREEEIKAIEYVKAQRGCYYKEVIKIIERQQQELKAEKEKLKVYEIANKNLKDKIKADDDIRDGRYIHQDIIKQNYISKDKIKEKIEELEKSKELDEDRKKLPFDLLQEQNKNIDYEIQALKELLN